MRHRALLSLTLALGCVSSPNATPPRDADVDSVNITNDASMQAPWRSRFYPSDWSAPGPGAGAVLHDFSYAGYRHGEDPPRVAGPTVSVRDTGADPSGARDSTAAFREALARLPATGGVVYVAAGTYRLDDDLRVSQGGVVLRGEGPSSRLIFTRRHSAQGPGHITFQGAPHEGPALALAEDGETFSDTVLLAAAESPPRVDDEVVIGFNITEAFVAEHQMEGVWRAFNGQWQPVFRRRVRAVSREGDGRVRVRVDVPLRYGVKVRDGAALRVETGALHEVGVEDLALTNTLRDWAAARAEDQVHLVVFDHVRDGWVRGGDELRSARPGRRPAAARGAFERRHRARLGPGHGARLSHGARPTPRRRRQRLPL